MRSFLKYQIMGLLKLSQQFLRKFTWKCFKKPYFEVFTRAAVVNMKNVTEPLRNSLEILSTHNLIIFRIQSLCFLSEIRLQKYSSVL